ncbi:hypothetical protein C440_05832 [Haloferax mucosum ATCC BAA-1512]|uniref:Uncharacterized protein n=1 Tax=Haloferax mucosum ATCC BAA-1512 TaxID=662479 RepID=M0IH61_9EURY|nr:hypothetical protein C440_05832 [Haloferax mucosum ATCC BAA-1512]
MGRSFSASDTHFEIVRSETSISNDGLRKGEPAALVCGECGASLPLTRQRSPGIDELSHEPTCDQRYVRSRFWQVQFKQD